MQLWRVSLIGVSHIRITYRRIAYRGVLSIGDTPAYRVSRVSQYSSVSMHHAHLFVAMCSSSQCCYMY